MTLYEKIMKMSPERLAEFLEDCNPEGWCPDCLFNRFPASRKFALNDCQACVRACLKEEVVEDEIG